MLVVVVLLLGVLCAFVVGVFLGAYRIQQIHEEANCGKARIWNDDALGLLITYDDMTQAEIDGFVAAWSRLLLEKKVSAIL